VRCFIALPLPAGARDFLAAALAPLGRRGSGLSWTSSENYHLTLAFLGELDEAEVESAAAALDCAAGFGEIRFSFEGWGSFPPRGDWRVLYARIADGGRSEALNRQLGRALSETGQLAAGRPIAEPRATGAAATGAAAAGPAAGPVSPRPANQRAATRGRPGAADFKPHITLARAGPRARRGERPTLPRLSDEETGQVWTITRCSLYKSLLLRSGAVYTELRGVDLSLR
jgi:RNA 2',3'-cyclic 3'-phosphodiesterase